VVTITAAAPGGPVTLQMRAWDAVSATYAKALTSGESGKSALLTLTATGNPNGSPPGTPVDLIGLTGFKMSLAGPVVPEPSTLALVLLGGAALLIRRRK
jgi:hypothetical protein